MSIDELEATYSPRTLDRTPPQNVEAEQSVLGAMMLSKDAMADVIEVVRASDFYRPAHEMVFDTATKLYNSGDPVDALTVGSELQHRDPLCEWDKSLYWDRSWDVPYHRQWKSLDFAK